MSAYAAIVNTSQPIGQRSQQARSACPSRKTDCKAFFGEEANREQPLSTTVQTDFQGRVAPTTVVHQRIENSSGRRCGRTGPAVLTPFLRPTSGVPPCVKRPRYQSADRHSGTTSCLASATRARDHKSTRVRLTIVHQQTAFALRFGYGSTIIFLDIVARSGGALVGQGAHTPRSSLGLRDHSGSCRS